MTKPALNPLSGSDSLNQMYPKVNSNEDILANAIGVLEQKVDANKAAADSGSGSVRTDMTNLINQTKTDLQAQITTGDANLQNQINVNKTAADNTDAANLAAAKSYADQQVSAAITPLQNTDANLQNQITSNFNTLDAKITDTESRVNGKIDSNQLAINTRVDGINSALNNRIDQVAANNVGVQDLNSRVSEHIYSTNAHDASAIGYHGAVSSERTTQGAIDFLSKQITNIVASSGGGNTEVIDARLGADQVVRNTLGELIREIQNRVLNAFNYSERIYIQHNFNDYPDAHVVVDRGFGMSGFGYGQYSSVDRFKTPHRIDYDDMNNMYVMFEDDLGTVTSQVLTGNVVHLLFSTGVAADIYLRRNA